MSHTTVHPELEVVPGSPLVERMRTDGRPDHALAAAYFDLWCAARGHGSYLHDPLTCSVLLHDDLVTFADGRAMVDECGRMDLTGESRRAVRASVGALLDPADPLLGYLGETAADGDGEEVGVRFSVRAAYAPFLAVLEQRLFP